jgi:hypothetical protein
VVSVMWGSWERGQGMWPQVPSGGVNWKLGLEWPGEEGAGREESNVVPRGVMGRAI